MLPAGNVSLVKLKVVARLNMQSKVNMMLLTHTKCLIEQNIDIIEMIFKWYLVTLCFTSPKLNSLLVSTESSR